MEQLHQKVFMKGNSCQLEHAALSGITGELSQKNLRSFVKEHHQFIIDNIDEDGIYNYDLFPHHIWSNPLLFREFYNLDKRGNPRI